MDASADRRRGAGEFLRSRRERVEPGDVGLAPGPGLRRVPGLRRDELARLAGVSVEYYVRLEQGRAGSPSDSVVDGLASALQLDESETDHLRDLCRPPKRPRQTEAPERVRPEIRRLLESIGLPALVFGRRTDVLAWNDAASALLVDFGALDPHDRNLARLLFLNDGFASLMVDWEPVAKEAVGVLRMAAGRHPDDPSLASLVGELTVKSPAFSSWWNARSVRHKTNGPKRIEHPQLGRLDLRFEALRLPADGDQALATYFAAEPGSPTETALALLGAANQPGHRSPKATGMPPSASPL